MKLVCYAFATALLIAPLPAAAQNAQPATPQTKPATPAKSDAAKNDAAKSDAAKSDTPSADSKKEKKPRSEAQKVNDDRMRACGKEWRDAKAANKTGGKTWREFSTECRRKKKAGG